MNILIIITYNYHVMLVYMFKPGPSSLHGICNKISAVYELFGSFLTRQCIVGAGERRDRFLNFLQ